MKKKILATVPLFSMRCAQAKKMLEDADLEVIEYKGDLVMTTEEIRAVGSDIVGAIIGCDEWNDEVFDACPQLKVIARFGIGYENIDLDAATRHGVKVCNVRGVNCDSVGEATIMFVLACLRNLVTLTDTTKEGQWMRYTGHTLKGKTYGLVGFGAVARYVAKLLTSFDVAKIYAYDLYPNMAEAERLGVTMTDLDTIVRECDVISLHVPCTPETTGLFNEEMFRKMKKDTVFVNVARGPIVDTQALCKALNEGWIAAAALDVFAVEPVEKDSPILTAKNLICMPHQAADTYETFDAVGQFDAKIVLDVLQGIRPQNELN